MLAVRAGLQVQEFQTTAWVLRKIWEKTGTTQDIDRFDPSEWRDIAHSEAAKPNSRDRRRARRAARNTDSSGSESTEKDEPRRGGLKRNRNLQSRADVVEEILSDSEAESGEEESDPETVALKGRLNIWKRIRKAIGDASDHEAGTSS